jgi:hypothetical protein
MPIANPSAGGELWEILMQKTRQGAVVDRNGRDSRSDRIADGAGAVFSTESIAFS